MNITLSHDHHGNYIPYKDGDPILVEASGWGSDEDTVREATPLPGWYDRDFAGSFEEG